MAESSDVRQFFPSVDHAVLRGLLQRRVSCPHILRLIDTVLQSGAGVLDGEYDMVFFAGDDLLAVARARGLPIGNLSSQFWANVYLDALDQFVTRELGCTAYLRYVDDFLLFGHDKRQLWQHKTAIREHLAALRLTMHERSSTVYPVKNGIPFLGMRLLPGNIRLKTRNARAFEARLREMQAAVLRGDMNIEEVSRRIAGWVAHASHADTLALRHTLFAKFSFTPPPRQVPP